MSYHITADTNERMHSLPVRLQNDNNRRPNNGNGLEGMLLLYPSLLLSLLLSLLSLPPSRFWLIVWRFVAVVNVVVVGVAAVVVV